MLGEADLLDWNHTPTRSRLETPSLGQSNSSLDMRSAEGAISSPTSPSQDDARRAAETLVNWMQNTQAGFVNNEDLFLVLRLMEKLGLQQQKQIT